MSAFPGFKPFGSNTNPQGQPKTANAFYWSSQGAKGSAVKPAVQKPMGLGAMGGFQPQGQLGQVAGKVQKFGQSLPPSAGAIGPAYNADGSGPPSQQQQPGYQATFRDLYGGALASDFQNIQKASEGNRQANLQYGAGMQQQAYGDAAQHEQLGMQQGDALDELGNKVMQGGMEEGNKYADLVKQRVEDTEAGFKDRAAEDAAAQAFGMDKQLESTLKGLESGMGPDGMPMTPEQQGAMRQQMLDNYLPQKQAAMSKVMSDVNNAMASLRTQGTGLISQAGQFALGHQQATQQLAAGLSQASSALRMGANALAMQRRMEGDMAGYQILSQNPFSPTSLAAVFASMMEVADSGAGQQPTGYGQQFIGAMQ